MIKLNLALLVLIMPFYTTAQVFTPKADWRFENFNNQNHFTSRYVQDLAIDKFGYAWACTIGLARFDGYKSTEYNSFDGGEGSLKSNYTAYITVDGAGKVWISSNGLCYYDNLSGKFNYVQPDKKHVITYAYAFIRQKNYLWFVCNYGLAKIDVRSLKISFTSIKQIADPMQSYLPDENTLWITSRNTLYKYNISRNTYTAKAFIYHHSLLKITDIEKGNHFYFIATIRGLMSLKDERAVPEIIKGVENIHINDMKFLPGDKEKKYLLIATDGQGLVIYNTFLKKVEFTYVHDEVNPYSVPSNIITKIFADEKGRLWFGTAIGITMLDTHNQQWKIRLIKKNTTNVLGVYRILQDKYDTARVWMLCNSTGLICIDWKTKKIEKSFGTDVKLQKLKDFVQIDKTRWLLLNNNELLEWDEKNGIERSTSKFPIADSVSLAINLRRIIKVNAEDYLIATSRGLFKYNLSKHKISAASVRKDVNNYYHNYDLVNGFYDKGIAWFASRDGLFKYNVIDGKTTFFSGANKYDYFLSDIAKAGTNTIACAASNGLLLFDRKKGAFRIIHSLAKIKNPAGLAIASISNKIWLGSDAGILSYNLNTNKSERVIFETPFAQVFASSPMALIGGDIVFGFTNGYAYFDTALKNIPAPSDPVIEDAYVNNQFIPIHNNDRNVNRNLVFGHDDNSIDIHFTSFLFSNPGNINFRYRLKGVDKQWHSEMGQRNANYSQLEPGNYTFYVQCGNINGVWNDHIATLNFLINPPYWQTWWFRFIVLLVFALILYRFYLYRINNIKAIENIRDGIASDFHDDLGSALSIISIYSEVALKKADSDLIGTKNIVEDMGTRARGLVQSMSDMVWTIKPENDTLYHLMQRMEEFAYPVAEAKEIQLVFTMNESLSGLKIDMLKRKSLFLIFKEAFNNAIKYSGAKKIQVLFNIEQKKMLTMEVTDDGVGFNLAKKGQGNGLANMQKRAKEINGRLKILTGLDTGTSIFIKCKIN